MDLATRLGATPANVATASTGGVGKDILTNKVTTDLDGADMYSVMAVLSAACNYNPVIFLKYPPNYCSPGSASTTTRTTFLTASTTRT